MCTEVRYGTRDYDETVALRDEVLRQPLGLSFTPEELREDEDSFHLACWRDGILVACLVLEPLPGKRVRMRQLAVRLNFQHRGIGRTLVLYSEAFARECGYEEAILHARETAVGFWEKTGYEVDGERFIEVTIPHFLMRKNLSAHAESQDAG